MAQEINVQELRELHCLAGKLRSSAAATIDLRYIDLFMRAAAALDSRASQLAQGEAGLSADRDRHAALHAPVSLVC